MEMAGGMVAVATAERTIEPPPEGWSGNKLPQTRIVTETISANMGAAGIGIANSWNTYFVGNYPQAIGAMQMNALSPKSAENFFTYSSYGFQPLERVEFPVATSLEVQQLRKDFELLASEVRKLSAGEPRLSMPELSPSAPRGYQAASLDELKVDLGTEISGDAWLDLFDFAAEAETQIPSVVLLAAEKGLNSDDPAVRSVAARALVASGEVALVEKVRQAVEREPNSLVARTITSALRGAAG